MGSGEGRREESWEKQEGSRQVLQKAGPPSGELSRAVRVPESKQDLVRLCRATCPQAEFLI